MYYKSNNTSPIDGFALIEDSKKLTTKAREFLNSVCKYISKSYMAQKTTQMNTNSNDPTKTPPPINKMPPTQNGNQIMMVHAPSPKYS